MARDSVAADPLCTLSFGLRLFTEGEGEFPGFGPPGPQNRGASFFFGGEGSSVTTVTQSINLTEGAELIYSGVATFTLGGFFGGLSGQEDNAKLAAVFRKAGDVFNGVSIADPITNANRLEQTGLLERLVSGPVPPNTRSIRVELILTRTAGNRNDGYADNLSLVLKAPVGANFDDPGRGDTHTSLIDWGDHHPPGEHHTVSGIVNEALGEGTVLGDHIYVDNGVYPVSVTVTDDDHSTAGDGQSIDGFNVTVLNVAPVVAPVAPVIFVVDKPESNKLMATFSDVGLADSHTASINWGDGLPNSSGSVSETLGTGTGNVRGNHQYLSANLGGSFPRDITALLTVTDKDGGFNTVPVVITLVDIEIPTILAGPNRSIFEAGSISAQGSFAAVPGEPTLNYT